MDTAISNTQNKGGRMNTSTTSATQSIGYIDNDIASIDNDNDDNDYDNDDDSIKKTKPYHDNNDENSDDHSFSTSSHNKGNFTATTTKTAKEIAAEQERQTLAHQETRIVIRLRIVVLLVLLISAIISCRGVYRYATNQEYLAFETQYHARATRLVEQFVQSMERKLGAMDGLAMSLTSWGSTTTSTTTTTSSSSLFPNVTLPHMAFYGSTARVQSESMVLFWAPLVTDEMRNKWEAYSTSQIQDHQVHWNSYSNEFYARSLQDERLNVTTATSNDSTYNPLQDEFLPLATQLLFGSSGSGGGSGGLPPQLPTFQGNIWEFTADEGRTIQPLGQGPYFPLWQMSPLTPIPAMQNLNLATLLPLRNCILQAAQTGQAVMDRSIEDISIDGAVVEGDDGNNEEEDVVVEEEFSFNFRALFNVFLSLGQYRGTKQVYSNDPLTPIAYPVFDGFDVLTRKVAGVIVSQFYWRLLFTDILADTVQGMICVLENAATDEEDDDKDDSERSHYQVFSYRVDGPDPVYLGPSDFHDTRYDSMERSVYLAEFATQRSGLEDLSFTRVPLNNNHTSNNNNYRLRVYPSQEMQDEFITIQPVVYTVVVGCVFLFTSFVFFLYDVVVERRQTVVMDRAVKSTAIVSSLYPASVRDRILNENDTPGSGGGGEGGETTRERPSALTKSSSLMFSRNSRHTNSSTHSNGAFQNSGRQPSQSRLTKMTSLLHSRADGVDNDEEGLIGREGNSNTKKESALPRPISRPKQQLQQQIIADRFHHTTILFADLAGFTKWSSGRPPEHVFVLLGAIYEKIDEIAQRRHVFKVETIGDCYMAVTGLPEKQPDHAVRMAKFARELLIRTKKVVAKLQIELGEAKIPNEDTRLDDDTVGTDDDKTSNDADTRKEENTTTPTTVTTSMLRFRIGLHSGAVTAGVLRGDKARFQLFGDTVNTASRMESAGIPGQIHCSQATATELCNANRKQWLYKRKGRIFAKGKGHMQTYFVDSSRGVNKATSTSSSSQSSNIRTSVENSTSEGNTSSTAMRYHQAEEEEHTEFSIGKDEDLTENPELTEDDPLYGWGNGSNISLKPVLREVGRGEDENWAQEIQDEELSLGNSSCSSDFSHMS